MTRSSTYHAAAWALACGLAVWTSIEAIHAYDDFRSGWSWDLAYYNQWFWSLTRGDGTITVRPIASYAVEGPAVTKMNYLPLIRFLIAPLYALWPDPRLLLIVQSVVFWWIIPAAYGLVRSESRSPGLGLLAAGLVPLTPLAWPLVGNDFRELQLALPFVLWAIEGWRGRCVRLTTLGVAGLIACRQEFAILAASLILLPPREREPIGRTFLWSRNVLRIGLGWFFVIFLGYLYVTVGRTAPGLFLNEFGGPKPPLLAIARTAAEILAVGMGPWILWAALAPRVLLLAVPWIYGLAGGKWAMHLLAGESWHHVRYAAPMVATVLAAGLSGFAQAGRTLLDRRRGVWLLGGAIALTGGGLLWSAASVATRTDRIPRPVPASDVDPLWTWIERVGPNEGVLTAYEVAAPLSGRRYLYSNRLEVQRPPGFPDHLPSEIRWAFLRIGDLDPAILAAQGFREVYRGALMIVAHRDPAGGAAGSIRPDARFGSPRMSRFEPSVLLLRVYDQIPTLLILAPGLVAAYGARRLMRRAWAIAPEGHSPIRRTGRDVIEALTAASGSSDPPKLIEDDGPMIVPFDARFREIRLPGWILQGSTPDALAFAVREAGSVIQSDEGTHLARLRGPLVLGAGLGASAAWILVLAGVLIEDVGLSQWGAVVYLGAVAAAVALGFLTRDGSRRAMDRLELAGLPELLDAKRSRAAMEAADWDILSGIRPFGRFPWRSSRPREWASDTERIARDEL